jgi:hypothetical protein
MTSPLDDVCCARVPASALSHLARLRLRADVRVKVVDGAAWLYWPAGDDEVLRQVLPIEGAEVFARRADFWYRPGRHLPAFDVVAEEGARSLLHLVSPAPVRPARDEDGAVGRVPLGIARDARPRAATALWCSLAELGC